VTLLEGGPVHEGRMYGERALIVGGSNGIGRAVAEQLATEGADIAFSWFRDRDGAGSLVRQVEGMGRQCTSIRASLTSADAPEQLMEKAIAELGPPTLLACCAAFGRVGRMLGSTPKEWARTFDVNVAALLSLTNTAREAGALRSVVAISSAGATSVLPGYGVVGVSKAALEALVRYAAAELAPTATINAVRPGPVDTKSFRRMYTGPDRSLSGIAAQLPMKRVVRADDVASLVCFLLSSQARMITGQTVVIDGGGSLHAMLPPSDVEEVVEEVVDAH
jgi:enoyl-[acyl-carrier protein] reductase III